MHEVIERYKHIPAELVESIHKYFEQMAHDEKPATHIEIYKYCTLRPCPLGYPHNCLTCSHADKSIIKDVYNFKKELEECGYYCYFDGQGSLCVSKVHSISLWLSKIDEQSKAELLKFHNYLFAQGLSRSRVIKYLTHLRQVALLLNKPFARVTKEDIIDLVRRIESRQDYSGWTKRDYKVAIKRFYKWLRGDEEYPEEVRWIKSNRRNNNHLLPEELLTEEEIKQMTEAADNPRDRALVFVLYESGCRIGEILSLKIRNVQFDEHGSILLVNGKTGSRRVRIIASAPLLASWINIHPDRENPDAPLWVTQGTRKNRHLNYRAANDTIKKIAKNAGIKKNVYPHLFRHSRATYLAKHLTEAQMKKYFGWTKDSKMASVYVHLSGRDVDEAILRIHGKLDENEKLKHEQLKTQVCPICGHENAPEADFCLRCGRPLNLRASLELEEKERELLRLITPEMIERMIQKKVEEILAKYMPQIQAQAEPAQRIKVMV